jgi:murein L,D-transpeptidase YcbB/YkuD
MASTAIGLLVLSGHAASAQQALTEQQIQTAVPAPDTSLPPPPTLKDLPPLPTAADTRSAEPDKSAAGPSAAAVQAEAPKAESAPAESKETTAPAAAPSQSAAAPAAEPAKAGLTNAEVASSLRELIASKQFERIVGRKADRAGVEAFYKAHDYAPIWVTDGTENARARSASDYLGRADDVGLDPADYPVPTFKADMSADALAAAELKLTDSALTFARHAQVGRISFTRVANDINFHQELPQPDKVLEKLAASDKAADALDSYNPPQPEFKALREKLAELRHGKIAATEEKPKPAPVHVAEGKILRPGMKDARVIALRQRLNVSGDKSSPLYDEAVLEAVKAFQLSADIGSDGLLGPNTIRALNGEKHIARKSPRNPIDTIIVNMERWRWFPRDLGEYHVIVNVPDYTLTLYDHGKVDWKTKIVAGKPGKATPMISAEMKYITVNPTWNVPPSIIQNEYLPALQEDPEALDRIGLKLEQNPDGTVRIYQPPGAANALGRIRFNFPNKFLVYQHDTPDKYLFARDKRAYSHGCMRVQYPETYAVKLLALADPQEHYSERRIESMYGNSEININFKKPIWVHLTYQTAFVDTDGKLQFRDDVYGRDARMIDILKGSERKVADIPVDRPPNTSAKPVRMPAGLYAGGRGYGGYDRGPDFFGWLFGGPSQMPRYDSRGYRDQGEPVYRPHNFIGPRARTSGRYYTNR